jgi:hypothetical protein
LAAAPAFALPVQLRARGSRILHEDVHVPGIAGKRPGERGSR